MKIPKDLVAKIPKDLIKDIETINLVIEALKFKKLELQGKTVKSTKGIVNKIKFYLLGYMEKKKNEKNEEQICPFCKVPVKVVYAHGGHSPFFLWQCEKCKYVSGETI